MKKQSTIDWTGFAVPKEPAVRLTGNEYTRFKKEIHRRDGYRCQNPDCGDPYARGPMNALTIHHKTKRSQNGSDTPENCATICLKCHEAIEHHELSEDFLSEGEA
jgi:5-methylcytosine-specific restriction endonuclease McrA